MILEFEASILFLGSRKTDSLGRILTEMVRNQTGVGMRNLTGTVRDLVVFGDILLAGETAFVREIP